MYGSHSSLLELDNRVRGWRMVTPYLRLCLYEASDLPSLASCAKAINVVMSKRGQTVARRFPHAKPESVSSPSALEAAVNNASATSVSCALQYHGATTVSGDIMLHSNITFQ